MAASRTPTRKSAPNKVPALVNRWMEVLRADITFLPNHDTYRASEKFREVRRNCRRNNWPCGQLRRGRQERRRGARRMRPNLEDHILTYTHQFRPGGRKQMEWKSLSSSAAS